MFTSWQFHCAGPLHCLCWKSAVPHVPITCNHVCFLDYYMYTPLPHTNSHTQRYMSTNAWAALRARKPSNPIMSQAHAVYTPIKASIHTDTQRAEPRVKTKHVYVTRSLCYTAFMILDSILSYSMLLNCKRLFSFSTSSVFRHIV